MESLTELNRAHFDSQAASYDTKHEKATQEIAKRINAQLDFLGVDWITDESSEEEEEEAKANEEPEKIVRVLDYACGTGSMSRVFAPYTTQCIGIDLSEKMVEAYNARAQNQGLSDDEMVAYCGDLCMPEQEDPEAFRDTKFFNFDMACVGLGFHHFDDPELAARRLVARLKPGGVLMIVDFLPHGLDSDHGHDHGHGDDKQEDGVYKKAMETVTHHGFSEQQIKDIFTNAGAGKDFGIEKMGTVMMGLRHGKRDLFMARGTKA
ncbi:unnamed protein product [Discula destructiva]